MTTLQEQHAKAIAAVVEEFQALCGENVPGLPAALGRLLETVNHLASVQAASAVARPIQRIQQHIEDIDKVLHGQSDKMNEINRRINGRVGQLDAVSDQFREDGVVGQLQTTVAQMAFDIERLKERQAGDGSN